MVLFDYNIITVVEYSYILKGNNIKEEKHQIMNQSFATSLLMEWERRHGSKGAKIHCLCLLFWTHVTFFSSFLFHICCRNYSTLFNLYIYIWNIFSTVSSRQKKLCWNSFVDILYKYSPHLLLPIVGNVFDGTYGKTLFLLLPPLFNLLPVHYPHILPFPCLV